MDLKIKLNTKVSNEALKDASTRKKASNETLEESWDRILSGKNTASDHAKLTKVKSAMLTGDIGREAPKVDAKTGKTRSQGKFSKAEALRLHAVLIEKERIQKLKDLVDNKPDNYYLLTTEEQVNKLNSAVLAEEIVAFDVETTGVDIFTDEILGISFTLPSVDRHYYVALQPMDDVRSMPIETLQLLKPCLESNVKKVAHNGTFDIAILSNYGINVGNLWHDTMTAMFLLNENERDTGGNYQLKSLVPKYLRKDADTFGALFGKEKDFRKIALDPFYIYGCKDTHVTWDLYQFQVKHLAKMPKVLDYLYNVEMPLINLNLKMEKQGFQLDLDFAKVYGEQLDAEAKIAHDYVVEVLSKYREEEDGEELNLNSPKQILPLLSKAVGKELPNLDAKKTLKPLKKSHKVVEAFLKYKENTKMSGTYIEGLPQKIHPATGRLHSRFDSNGTVTGRYSSGKDKDGESEGDRTNIQNQPYEARKMFKVPEGRVWISADFKSQEIVVAGALSNEQVIIDAFAQGKDNYAMMASKAFNKPYEECYKKPDGSDTQYRKDMKVIFLAKLYGMSVNSLASLLGQTKEMAQEFSDSFDSSMPQLAQWIEENTSFVKRNGYVWIGREERKRRLPKAKEQLKKVPWGKYWDPEFMLERQHNAEVNRSIRQATNARVQGEAAIMTKVTMLKMDEYLATIGGFIVAPIHDELVMEVNENISRKEVDEIKRVMIQSYQFESIKNGTDLEFFMTRWGTGVAEKDLVFDSNDQLDVKATQENIKKYERGN